MESLNYGQSSKWDRKIFYVSLENYEQIKEDSFQIFLTEFNLKN